MFKKVPTKEQNTCFLTAGKGGLLETNLGKKRLRVDATAAMSFTFYVVFHFLSVILGLS